LSYAYYFRNPEAAGRAAAKVSKAFESAANNADRVSHQQGAPKGTMAKAIGDDFFLLHKLIYPKLSSAIHSDALGFFQHVGNDGVRPYVEEGESEAYIWFFVLTLFLISEVLLELKLQKYLCRDLKYVGKRIAHSLVATTIANNERGTHLDPEIIAFVDYLSKAVGFFPWDEMEVG
jgi:hypothetical protein